MYDIGIYAVQFALLTFGGEFPEKIKASGILENGKFSWWKPVRMGFQGRTQELFGGGGRVLEKAGRHFSNWQAKKYKEKKRKIKT